MVIIVLQYFLNFNNNNNKHACEIRSGQTEEFQVYNVSYVITDNVKKMKTYF